MSTTSTTSTTSCSQNCINSETYYRCHFGRFSAGYLLYLYIFSQCTLYRVDETTATSALPLHSSSIRIISPSSSSRHRIASTAQSPATQDNTLRGYRFRRELTATIRTKRFPTKIDDSPTRARTPTNTLPWKASKVTRCRFQVHEPQRFGDPRQEHPGVTVSAMQ